MIYKSSRIDYKLKLIASPYFLFPDSSSYLVQSVAHALSSNPIETHTEPSFVNWKDKIGDDGNK